MKETSKCMSLLLILSTLTLSACSDKMLPTEVLQEIPDTVEKVAGENTNRLGLITSVSLGKEIVSQRTYENVYARYFDAVQNSGTKITMKQVTKTVSLDGKMISWTEDAIDTVTHTPTPGTAWMATISQHPSQHPGWKTFERVTNSVFKWGTIMFGIDRFTGMVNGLNDTPTYSNSPIIQSQNTAGTTQQFAMDGQYQGPYAPKGVDSKGTEGVSGSTCPGDQVWYNGTCYSTETAARRGFPIGD